MSDDEFVSADSGAAGTTPIRVGELKKGMMVMIKGHACKIVDYSTVRRRRARLRARANSRTRLRARAVSASMRCMSESGWLLPTRARALQLLSLRSPLHPPASPARAPSSSYSAQAKTGKHGSAKAMYVGIDIFSGNKHEDTAPTGANTAAPVVERREWLLTDINDDDANELGSIASLLDAETGDTRDDLRVPDDKEYANMRTALAEDSKDVFVMVIEAIGKGKILPEFVQKDRKASRARARARVRGRAGGKAKTRSRWDPPANGCPQHEGDDSCVRDATHTLTDSLSLARTPSALALSRRPLQ